MDAETSRVILIIALLAAAATMYLRSHIRARAIPPHERNLIDAMLAIEKRRKADPAAADRETQALMERYAAAEQAYRAELRTRVSYDKKAVVALRQRLLQDLEGIASIRKETTDATGAGIEKSRREMDEEERNTRRELEQLDQLLGRAS